MINYLCGGGGGGGWGGNKNFGLILTFFESTCGGDWIYISGCKWNNAKL